MVRLLRELCSLEFLLRAFRAKPEASIFEVPFLDQTVFFQQMTFLLISEEGFAGSDVLALNFSVLWI